MVGFGEVRVQTCLPVLIGHVSGQLLGEASHKAVLRDPPEAVGQ